MGTVGVFSSQALRSHEVCRGSHLALLPAAERNLPNIPPMERFNVPARR